MAKKSTTKTVEAIKHPADKRKNIPTAEFQSVVKQEQQSPIRLAYDRRNRDLDPQLVWRGKDEQDWSELVVHVPPIYIQEKVHPKVLIDDLLRQSQQQEKEGKPVQLDLFADFNGLPDKEALTEFYQHDANWSNRMILGDSLSGDGKPRRARGAARQGAVHLYRPALRHPLQLELAGVHVVP